MRHRRRRRAGAGEQVTALNADRFDIDKQAPLGTVRVGDLLVAQDLGRTVLMDHRRLHSRPLYSTRACANGPSGG